MQKTKTPSCHKLRAKIQFFEKKAKSIGVAKLRSALEQGYTLNLYNRKSLNNRTCWNILERSI
jgi:hypothetical protein